MLRWIREGVKIDWVDKPPPKFHHGDSLQTDELSDDEKYFLSKEVPRCLQAGAWRETDDDSHVSKAFLVPKAGSF
eukprot:SAG31_NODE_1526_length_8004_cov_4.741176_5_plen_75_part_00